MPTKPNQNWQGPPSSQKQPCFPSQTIKPCKQILTPASGREARGSPGRRLQMQTPQPAQVQAQRDPKAFGARGGGSRAELGPVVRGRVLGGPGRADVRAWGRPTRRPARSRAGGGRCRPRRCVSREVGVRSLRPSPFAWSRPPRPCGGPSWCRRRAPSGPAEPGCSGERASGSPCLPVSGRPSRAGGRWATWPARSSRGEGVRGVEAGTLVPLGVPGTDAEPCWGEPGSSSELVSFQLCCPGA